jgi:hypothetical protein
LLCSGTSGRCSTRSKSALWLRMYSDNYLSPLSDSYLSSVKG